MAGDLERSFETIKELRKRYNRGELELEEFEKARSRILGGDSAPESPSEPAPAAPVEDTTSGPSPTATPGGDPEPKIEDLPGRVQEPLAPKVDVLSPETDQGLSGAEQIGRRGVAEASPRVDQRHLEPVVSEKVPSKAASAPAVDHSTAAAWAEKSTEPSADPSRDIGQPPWARVLLVPSIVVTILLIGLFARFMTRHDTAEAEPRGPGANTISESSTTTSDSTPQPSNPPTTSRPGELEATQSAQADVRASLAALPAANSTPEQAPELDLEPSPSARTSSEPRVEAPREVQAAFASQSPSGAERELPGRDLPPSDAIFISTLR